MHAGAVYSRYLLVCAVSRKDGFLWCRCRADAGDVWRLRCMMVGTLAIRFSLITRQFILSRVLVTHALYRLLE